MGHYGIAVEKRNRRTPKEWLATAKIVADLVNDWSNRDDLICYLSEDGGYSGKRKIAAAFYDPATAEIEVNTADAFGPARPQHIGDLRNGRVQVQYAKGVGCIYHESMHAKYTTWDLHEAHEALGGEVHETLMLLEEPRIEHRGVMYQPRFKPFLKTCALALVISDVDQDVSETRQAAQLAALVLARIDGGVLDESDVTALKEKIETMLGEELHGKLQKLWREFITCYPEYDLARMYEIAIEWNRLVEETAEERGEKQEGNMYMFSDELGTAADESESSGQTEAATAQRKDEADAEAEAAAAKAREQQKHEDAAKRMFSAASGPNGGTTNSRLLKSRPPLASERQAAVTIARELEKAKYRDRERISSSSMIPPGRMRMRGAIQNQASVRAGGMPSADVWRVNRHKQTDEPNLTIGMMVDISSSMTRAMEPMASAAWIVSEAARRVQGKVAQVYYGNSVFPTLKPGQHLDEVKVYSASDGTEAFNEGFIALNGGLSLLNGSGARLLVICSDGSYGGGGQAAAAEKWLKACALAGVGVLWVSFKDSYDSMAQEYCKMSGATFFKTPNEDITTVASQIGRYAAEALTRAGQTRIQR